MNRTLKIIAIILSMTLLASICLSFMPNNNVFATNEATDSTKSVNLVSGAVYYIKNKYSGKYLNVNFGTDANGTNVNQWAYDGSTEQKWKIVQNSDGTWKIYAMCSSNGNNRVLDALRTGGSASGSIAAGNNVDIWAPNDPEAQNWILWDPADYAGAHYYISLASAYNPLVVTAYGSLNGSGSGTGPTSAGNVYIDSPTNDKLESQLWEFIRAY